MKQERRAQELEQQMDELLRVLWHAKMDTDRVLAKLRDTVRATEHLQKTLTDALEGRDFG